MFKSHDILAKSMDFRTAAHKALHININNIVQIFALNCYCVIFLYVHVYICASLKEESLLKSENHLSVK